VQTVRCKEVHFHIHSPKSSLGEGVEDEHQAEREEVPSIKSLSRESSAENHRSECGIPQGGICADFDSDGNEEGEIDGSRSAGMVEHNENTRVLKQSIFS